MHHERKSFIVDGPVLEPADQGWRGTLNKVRLRLDAGSDELMWREDVNPVAQHGPGQRVIAIANGKGSAHKTPTAVMLVAVFARLGDAEILAWDNNEARVSLAWRGVAWRAEQSNHPSAVLDLLVQAEMLLCIGAQSAEVSYYAHHHPEGKFDVLHSDQSIDRRRTRCRRNPPRRRQTLLPDDPHGLRQQRTRRQLARNDRTHPQLVLPCTNVEDTDEARACMLETLHGRPNSCRGLSSLFILAGVIFAK